ncbi:hypothetical protein MRB53_016369 [Persea americana]|uniref:Uncharacterized protein n=1 Tax=Persea americana TaxID=3435 RepID=A0ACC2M216_PERAE|nr:hypothetical protein MRB53_016369 [Persea americana]
MTRCEASHKMVQGVSLEGLGSSIEYDSSFFFENLSRSVQVVFGPPDGMNGSKHESPSDQAKDAATTRSESHQKGVVIV